LIVRKSNLSRNGRELVKRKTRGSEDKTGPTENNRSRLVQSSNLNIALTLKHFHRRASSAEGKRLYLRVGDEVNHLRYEEWGIGVVVEAMRFGAIDFVEKPLYRDKLLPLIERAVVQSRQFERNREERQKVMARIACLTPRQEQVMQLMLDGKSSKTIAAHLFMSRRTVESHRANVMTKMAAKSLPELARMASLTRNVSSDP